MTQQELLMELNRISSLMSNAEFINNIEDGDMLISQMIDLIKNNVIKESIFEGIICDVMKSYNSLYNTNELLRKKKKEMSDAYNIKDKEKAKEIMREVLQYQKDNKLNILELRLLEDIKFYMKYIDNEYYNLISTLY